MTSRTSTPLPVKYSTIFENGFWITNCEICGIKLFSKKQYYITKKCYECRFAELKNGYKKNKAMYSRMLRGEQG